MKKLYAFAALACSFFCNAQYPLASVSVAEPTPVCHPGDCVELLANYSAINATDQYSVSSVPYNPSFPFTGGTLINASVDDIWSPIFTLPFNFCFYGNTYNQILVGSNGVISFDIAGIVGGSGQTPGGYCNWPFTSPIPNAAFPIRNAIYGVYQDNNIASPPVVDPVTQNVNYYILDTGVNAAPNRVFVINYNELPMYQCNESAGLQTSQIVLHETTNIIEVFIKKRTSCTTWNSGNGLVGIQNQAGTLATVPPGRNTGSWSAFNEAWRFVPAGASVPTVLDWFADGILIANSTNPLIVCPTQNRIYSASVSYGSCNGNQTVSSGDVPVSILPPTPYGAPVNISNCEDPSGIYLADLSINDEIVLNGLPANDFYISYYTTQQDAEYNANEIINSQAWSFSTPMTMFIRAENLLTGCADIFSFNLEINPLPGAPAGDGVQYFTAGQTLADLVVSGQNITWYDSAVAGSELPLSTLLVNGSTYYASQTVNGCESRMAPGRLAVTVSDMLTTRSFSGSKLRVFPNPTENTLTVSGGSIIDRYEIFNLPGQKIATANGGSNELRIDISKFASGTYFLKMFAGQETRIVKIVRK